MSNENYYQNLVNLINSKIDVTNSKYPGLVSEKLRQKAIAIYVNSGKTIEDIDKELTFELEKMESIHFSLNPNELDTGLKTNHQGMYLSSLMITSLSLINCSNISEINKWIDSVPNLYMISQLPNGNYSNDQIDSIKRNLFEIYQDSMIGTPAVNDINSTNKEKAMRYALHKKLSGLNLPIENELDIGNIGFSKGLPSMYKEIERICIDKFGRETGKRISSKIVYYFTTDYENFNSSTYEQMVALNNQIKENIKKCNSIGGDFQLVLRSIGYENTVSSKLNDNNSIEYVYNYDISSMGQNLSEKLGASYRLRSMINRNAAEEISKKGLSLKDKELVIQILRNSLNVSLINFNSNIKNDGKNRSFELFNELVEIKKTDKNFKLVWEEKFGITLEDMVKQVIEPNMQLIKDLKTKNVDFMYNETMLQEAPEKRAKVMEAMNELQRLAPGLITVFGDQDHTFSSDYTPEKIEQLRETAEFDKQMDQLLESYNKIADILTNTHEKAFLEQGMSEKDALNKAKKKAYEDARFVLPNACETKIVVTMNVRTLFNFFQHRCCNRAQWEIKAVADEMLRLCKQAAPELFKNAGPSCVMKGKCPEGAMSCGKMAEVKKIYGEMNNVE